MPTDPSPPDLPDATAETAASVAVVAPVATPALTAPVAPATAAKAKDPSPAELAALRVQLGDGLTCGISHALTEVCKATDYLHDLMCRVLKEHCWEHGVINPSTLAEVARGSVAFWRVEGMADASRNVLSLLVDSVAISAINRLAEARAAAQVAAEQKLKTAESRCFALLDGVEKIDPTAIDRWLARRRETAAQAAQTSPPPTLPPAPVPAVNLLLLPASFGH